MRESSDKHKHTKEEERAIREAALDETIANSFPASDPPSSIPNPDQHDTAVNDAVSDEKDEPDEKRELRSTRSDHDACLEDVTDQFAPAQQQRYREKP
jgi:hypothetical protein